MFGLEPGTYGRGHGPAQAAATRAAQGPDEPLTFETRHRRKDGTVLPGEIRVGSFRRGGQRCYLALARDITERKRADEELRASETRFRTFVDRATDAFFLMDEHVIIVDVNRQPARAGLQVRGLPHDQAEGLGIGLSISRSIIEAHGGRLSAARNEPHGAVFRFTLAVEEGTVA